MNRCVTQVSTTTAQQPSLAHFPSAPSKIRALNLFPTSVCESKWQIAQRVKHQSKMRETQVRSLGQENPLGKGMATHFRILAWRIPWTGEPGGLQPTGSQSGTRLSDFPFSVCVFVCVRVWVASTDFWCLPPAPAHDVSSCCTIRHGHPSSVKLPKPGVYPHISGPACCLPLQARPHGGRSGF